MFLSTAVYLELIENSCKESTSVEHPVPVPDDEQNWNSELQRTMELSALKEIDNIEERVCSASLQVHVLPLLLQVHVSFWFEVYSKCVLLLLLSLFTCTQRTATMITEQ